MSDRPGPPSIEVEPDADGQRVDRFLKKRFPKLPHGLVHKLLRNRKITVNRSKVKADSRLSVGDHVELWTDTSAWEETPDDRLDRVRGVRNSDRFRRNFRVVHEDDHLIVLNKPGGLVVHPGPQHHGGDTLLDLLRAHLPEHFRRGSEYRPGFVHRLDRGTSGLIVAAKTRELAKSLEGILCRGEASKTYKALVHGRVRRDSGEIDTAIERTETSKGVSRYRARDADAGTGRSALTRWRVDQRFRGATLLDVEILTGRTHQIRAHFASLDHPLIGDGDYGRREVNRRFRDNWGLSRVFLHAAELEFPSPEYDEILRFRAEMPGDLLRVLDGISET